MKRDEKTKSARDKIIKAAFSLFSEKGYEATSTQDIISLTGLSRGAMYHHFKSKQEILETVTRQAQEQIHSFLEALVTDSTLSAKNKLSKIIAYNGESEVQKQLIACRWLEKIPFALVEEIRNLNHIIAPCLAQIIRQGVEEKEFECPYIEELAEVLALLLDIWLDPVLFNRTYEAICTRLDFVAFMLEKLGADILEKGTVSRIKSLYQAASGPVR